MTRVYLFVAASMLGIGLEGCPPKVQKRSDPVCAVRDCATGKIIDDGCTEDGRCASCVSPCGNDNGITPTTSELPAALPQR